MTRPASLIAAALLLSAAPQPASAFLDDFKERGFLCNVFRRDCAPTEPAETYALPDPIMTPGQADPAVDLNEICNGTTKRRRPPSTKICDRVFAAYNIPPATRYSYECDHDIPVALGGSTVAKNLWPQPLAEAHKKDRLEVEMQRLACVAFRTLTPEDAAKVLMQEQHEIGDDWPEAYRRYLGDAVSAHAKP